MTKENKNMGYIKPEFDAVEIEIEDECVICASAISELSTGEDINLQDAEF